MKTDLPTIGIVGMGFVGTATCRVWTEYATVRCYDIVPELANATLDETLQSDFVFLCLPTPALPDGRCDTRIIEKTIQAAPESQFVIKSTVPIGFSKQMAQISKSLLHSPEFLTSRCSIVDAHTPSRNLIGITGHKLSIVAGEGLYNLYKQRFPGIQCFVLDSDESEATKLMANNFFAAKVAFFNEWHKWCEYHKLNWDSVLAAVLADGRIAHSHTKVPGPDGLLGFGGTCLPKDLSNTVCHMEDAGIQSILLKAVIERNSRDR